MGKMVKPPTTEEKLLREFIEQKMLPGVFLRRIPVGWATSPPDLPSWRKEIDAVFLHVEDPAPRQLDGLVWESRFSLDHRAVLRRPFKKIKKVLGSLQGEAWIVEVKRKLNAEAVGQVLINAYLFTQDYPKLTICGKGIICEVSDELIQPVCEAHGVQVFAMGSPVV